MNICQICEASLSHHTLYMGNLVAMYTMYNVFPCWQKATTDVQHPPPPPKPASILKPTDNQKLDYCFGLISLLDVKIIISQLSWEMVLSEVF